MKKTGLVMEINGTEAIVMQTGGKIVKLKASRNWQKGGTVVLTDAPALPKRVMALAACFVLLLLGGVLGLQVYFTEVSLISIDINPSIEIGLNQFGTVISAQGMNEDGRQIVDTVEIGGSSYTDALAKLLNSAEMRPYFEANDYLTLSVYSEENEEELLSAVKQIVDEIAAALSVKTECHRVNGDTVEKAHSYNITPGKYAVLEELMEVLPEAEDDVEQYASQGITEIKEIIETCKRHRYGRNSGGHGSHGNTGNQAGNESTSSAGASSAGETTASSAAETAPSSAETHQGNGNGSGHGQENRNGKNAGNGDHHGMRNGNHN